MRPDLRRLIRTPPLVGVAPMATAPAHYRVDSDVERGADHVGLGGVRIRGWAMAAGIRAPGPSWLGDGG